MSAVTQARARPVGQVVPAFCPQVLQTLLLGPGSRTAARPEEGQHVRFPRREALAVHEGAYRAVLVVAMDADTTGWRVEVDGLVAPETAAAEGHAAAGGGDGVVGLDHPRVQQGQLGSPSSPARVVPLPLGHLNHLSTVLGSALDGGLTVKCLESVCLCCCSRVSGASSYDESAAAAVLLLRLPALRGVSSTLSLSRTSRHVGHSPAPSMSLGRLRDRH